MIIVREGIINICLKRLPCKSDFTLFDLTGDDPIIKKFQVYGQFLIIARNQN